MAVFNNPNYYGASYANEMSNPYARYQNFGSSYPQQNPNSINWVQGRAGAEAYPVAPGASVMLMDSNEAVLYVKSADNTGRPLPLKVYDLVERIETSEQQTAATEVTTVDYEKIRQIVSEEVNKQLAVSNPRNSQGKKESK